MKYRSIQQANCEDAIKRMEEAEKRGDKEQLTKAKEQLRVTLEAIENIDRETYSKYVSYLSS